MKTCRFAAALAGAAVATIAEAGVVNPLVPAWRGTANTMFMGWETFTAAYAGANAADMAGSSNLANLFNFGPGAVLTSAPMPTGIYNATGPLSIMIMGGVTSAPRNPTEVVMNLASAGTGISNASVALTLFDNAGNSMTLAPALAEIRYDAPAQPQGSIRTTAYTWNTSFVPFAATGFRVEFAASAGSMSLDAVRLDLNYVPAPGALALVGLAAVTARRRR